MPKVLREKKMQVSVASLKKAILDFENYPKFLAEVVGAKPHSISSAKKQKVDFELQIIKRFKYQLEFDVSKPVEISWHLVESDFFKQNEGRWVFKELSKNETHVTYELDLELGFLVPGWISKKLTEVNLPKVLENFEGRAKEIEEGKA